MRDRLWLIYFNVSLLCVLLMGAELIGQISYFAVKGYPLFDSDRYENATHGLFELHPYLVGRPKKNVRVEENNKTISTTDIHTRWTNAPVEDRDLVRISILGGSTTFSTRVTDADSWPALLQTALGNRYAITNYGVPGYSTAEAIIQLALIVPESQPHIVVFYEGWNDIANYHDADVTSDYFRHGMKQYANLGIPVKLEREHEPLLSRLAEVSSIFRFAAVAARELPLKASNQLDPKNEIYAVPDPLVDKIYLQHLKTLKLLAEGLGAKVIFIPQVLNYADFTGKTTSRPWSPHIEDDAMPALLHRFNLIMNDACVPKAPDCIVLNEVPISDWGPGDFVDDGHFSRAGGVKFSSMVAARVKEMIKGGMLTAEPKSTEDR
jgi:lysophospholipase L1-like esterase